MPMRTATLATLKILTEFGADPFMTETKDNTTGQMLDQSLWSMGIHHTQYAVCTA